MDKNQVYRVYSPEEEHCRPEKFASEEEAAAQGAELLALKTGDVFHVGVEYTMELKVDADTVLDELACQVSDEAGDESDWFDEVNAAAQTHSDDLSERLTKAATAWLTDRGIEPPIAIREVRTVFVVDPAPEEPKANDQP